MTEATEIVFHVSRIAGYFTRRLDANLSVHGISFSEFQVLHHLSESAQSTMPRVELARLMGITASGVTRMLAPMEKIGLIKKESHPRDARMSLVTLSEAGVTIYRESAQTMEHVSADLLGALSKVQREALATLGKTMA